MKFIHSSDLHIGKAFGFFEPDAAIPLGDARIAALRTLGEAAAKHGAAAVLLAGDVFDKQHLAPQTLHKSVETMRAFPRAAWHLLPGNHDCLRDNGLWSRLQRMTLPPNIHLHVSPGAALIADDGAPVYLLPAPLRHIASAEDLTAYMDAEATQEGAIRIGLAHGSIQGFGGEAEASNYVSPKRAESAGLAYLAMGDWHRQMKINARVWYSGAPEPDQFKRPPGATGTLCNGGAALLVEIEGPRAAPSVTPIETGRYRWHMIEAVLLEDAHIVRLEASLRRLEPDLSRAVLDLRVSGALSLPNRAAFEDRILRGPAAAMRAMRLDDGALGLEPTVDDLNAIGEGFIRAAAMRLQEICAGKDAARARLAALALKRLYVEHARQTEGS